MQLSEIRTKMDSLGIGATELASMTGVSRQHITTVISGKKVASEALLKRIKQALFDGESSPTKASINALVAQFRADAQRRELPLTEIIGEGEKCISYIGETMSDEDRYTIADIQTILADLYRRCKRYDKAAAAAYAAEITFLEIGEIASLCRASYEIANIDYEQANFGSSLNRLYHLRRLIEKNSTALDSNYLTLRVYSLLGRVAVEMSDYALTKECAEYCQENDDASPENMRLFFRATGKYLEAVALAEKGSYQDAVRAFSSAEDFYLAYNDFYNSIRMRSNIADTLRKSGDLVQAEKIATEVLTEKQIKDVHKNSLAETRLLLANIYLDTQRFEDARAICGPIIHDRDVSITKRAAAYELLARTKYREGDVEAFTSDMSSGIALLLPHRIHEHQMLRMTAQVYAANHSQEPIRF